MFTPPTVALAITGPAEAFPPPPAITGAAMARPVAVDVVADSDLGAADELDAAAAGATAAVRIVGSATSPTFADVPAPEVADVLAGVDAAVLAADFEVFDGDEPDEP